MQQKKKVCKSCGEEKYIWSREYGCKECTLKAKEKLKQSTERGHKPLKNTKLKQISNKQKTSNREVKLAKSKVINRHLADYGYLFCQSTGVSTGIIDCSHIIPISRRKDLEADEKNICLQSRTAHEKWERHSLECKEFINFDEMMDRVKELDPKYYKQLKVKFEL